MYKQDTLGLFYAFHNKKYKYLITKSDQIFVYNKQKLKEQSIEFLMQTLKLKAGLNLNSVHMLSNV